MVQMDSRAVPEPVAGRSPSSPWRIERRAEPVEAGRGNDGAPVPGLLRNEEMTRGDRKTTVVSTFFLYNFTNLMNFQLTRLMNFQLTRLMNFQLIRRFYFKRKIRNFIVGFLKSKMNSTYR